MDAPELMEWITLGPLTNAAMAIRREPRIVENVSMLTIMAGGVDAGNTSVMSEFNVFFDPEAARIVFDSDIPKTMVPLDPLWAGGHLSEANVKQIQAVKDKPWCDMAGQIFRKTIEIMAELSCKTGFERRLVSPPDLLAVAVAIDNSIAEIKEYPLYIETTGEYTRGMTVVDRRRFTHLKVDTNRKKVAVALSADQEKYAALVLDTWLKN